VTPSAQEKWLSKHHSGMIFKVMPERPLKYGYYAWLVLMLVVAISLLAIFRIKRWLQMPIDR
jgi:hypothetical protein